MLCLAGSERVGKSTLAKAYAEKMGYGYIPSRVSEIFRSFNLTPGHQPPEVRFMLQEAFLKAHIEDMRAKSGMWISDRSALDMACYMMLDMQNAEFDQSRVLEYVDRCFTVVNRYCSMIVLVQPGIPYVEEEGKLKRCDTRQELMNTVLNGMITDKRLTTTSWRLMRGTTALEQRMDSLARCSMAFMNTQNEMKVDLHLH